MKNEKGEESTDSKLKLTQKLYISPATHQSYQDAVELKDFPVTFCKQSLLLASPEKNTLGTILPALPCNVLGTKPETQYESHPRHFCYMARITALQ